MVWWGEVAAVLHILRLAQNAANDTVRGGHGDPHIAAEFVGVVDRGGAEAAELAREPDEGRDRHQPIAVEARAGEEGGGDSQRHQREQHCGLGEGEAEGDVGDGEDVGEPEEHRCDVDSLAQSGLRQRLVHGSVAVVGGEDAAAGGGLGASLLHDFGSANALRVC